MRAATPRTAEPPILHGQIAITVQSRYAVEHSDPGAWRYMFVYRVRIANTGDETARLFWRHWKIQDPVAGDQEVTGPGVVGESPVLKPGDYHEYESFCLLRGPSGHMEGFYHFRREDRSVFRAPIPRFLLHAPPEAIGGYLV